MIEIELNGPAKNALGTETMTALLEKVRAAKNEPLLLTGAGDAFSAGLNLKEIASLDEAGMRPISDAPRDDALARSTNTRGRRWRS